MQSFQGPNPFARLGRVRGMPTPKVTRPPGLSTALTDAAAEAGSAARLETRRAPGFPRTKDFPLKLY